MRDTAAESPPPSDEIPLLAASMVEVPAEEPPAPRRRRRGSRLLTWVGVILLVGGLGGLGWAGYDLFFNPLVDPAQSQAAKSELRSEWEASPPTSPTSPTSADDGPPAATSPEAPAFKPIPGKAVALLRIPAFGESFEQPVLVGTTDPTLARGLGWYDGTAKPGQVGNFALAGHRGSRGPFAPMPNLHKGDKIVVETRDAVYTYEVTNEPAQTMVMNTDTWVLDPVPGKPDVKATDATITLTTCFDLYHSPRRMILFGTLVDTVQKQ